MVNLTREMLHEREAMLLRADVRLADPAFEVACIGRVDPHGPLVAIFTASDLRHYYVWPGGKRWEGPIPRESTGGASATQDEASGTQSPLAGQLTLF